MRPFGSIHGPRGYYGTLAERDAYVPRVTEIGIEWRFTDQPGRIDKWDGTDWVQTHSDSAAHVTQTIPGVARNRFISAAHETAPTRAGTGTAVWFGNGIRQLRVDSVMVSAGTLPLTANNWTIRYALDCPTDASGDSVAAVLLPATFPSHDADGDVGQVGSFNVVPIYVPDTEAAGDLRVCQIILPKPIILYESLTYPIYRLDMIHNLGTGVTVKFGLSAVEVA